MVWRSERTEAATLRTAALRLRDLLADELGLTPFVKTTGGKGLHVQVSLRAEEDFDAVRGFARQAAGLLAGVPGVGRRCAVV